MNPMLLSDPAQGTLGVCKDSRTGLCLIQGAEVELFRFKGTGLKGLCISGDPDGEPYQVPEEQPDAEAPLRSVSIAPSSSTKSPTSGSAAGSEKGPEQRGRQHERPQVPPFPRVPSVSAPAAKPKSSPRAGSKPPWETDASDEEDGTTFQEFLQYKQHRKRLLEAGMNPKEIM